MSNEVKNKVDMDPKYIIKLTVTLFLTCMVVAGVLGWVNSITKDKIAAITWEKTVTAMKEVISADDFSDAMDLTDDMTAAATAQGGTLAAVYQAQSGGQPIGYAINVESSGSQGTISMMVGIDMDGRRDRRFHRHQLRDLRYRLQGHGQRASDQRHRRSGPVHRQVCR